MKTMTRTRKHWRAHTLRALSLTVAASLPQALKAAPFENCPNEAFLTQSKPALLYGVDLTTGSYGDLGDLGTPDKLNAMGFSRHDAFLYAWFYEGQTLARIHSDYTIEPLALSPSLPMDYFVGDVSVLDNAYYMYRKGGSYNGLWRIALDPAAADYLQPERVVEGSVLNIKIFDLAFHPDNGFAYSVDSRGKLWRIDPTGGAPADLGGVGESGTFGAVYFDVNGTL